MGATKIVFLAQEVIDAWRGEGKSNVIEVNPDGISILDSRILELEQALIRNKDDK